MSSRSREKELSTPEQIGALVDERLLTLLHAAFPPLKVQPGVSMDALQYDAGQQDVISFLALCRNQARDLSHV